MPEPMGDSWRVRVLDSAGVPVGAGVLLSSGRILTCAHVVEAALGLGDGEEPGGHAVTVDFPGSLVGSPTPAVVEPGCWAPPRGERGDVAVLRLRGRLPDDCPPAGLRPGSEQRGRTVWAYGHPAGLDEGVWLKAELLGYGGASPDWMQFALLDAAAEAPALERGFSGAGVVDESGHVLGIVVAAYGPRGRGPGWMLPVGAAARYCPPLVGEMRVSEGRAGHPPAAYPGSADTERRLTEALLRLPSIADPQRRDRILRDAGHDIADNVERSPVPREDVRAIVATSLRYADGLDRLVTAVRWYEGRSTLMTGLEDLLTRLRNGQTGDGR
ncbi:trypsin-like peptidase domain-containing protein [Streptomyces sp. DSM 44917]|uniref:Trypsin-like peptidase domain-containing protein n=1 Tax=Streptomyces boetiae TaxID=3075541 RepID=A0ABU2LG13_9ACTN|nr:trypsin-like peptidase domain-containing protein [Streptomyces sp. DSM 44917]MDT0310524.1 trypsin-like peptidase domain-containing protein [Streptomyces sp. DSM 44917]